MRAGSYFISDLHLDDAHPQMIRQFLFFLNQRASVAKELFILGDFFEVWIGDDDQAPWLEEIKISLHHAVGAGLEIYFMPGNRDFLIGKKFLQSTGMQILNDATLIERAGLKILLMHGDTLCIDDISYMRARVYLRHPLVAKLFLALPLWLRKRLANKARTKSASHTSMTSIKSMDAVQSEIRKQMQLHQAQYLIHGHTHQPGIHLIDQTKRRIVLGAWHARANALLIDAEGNKDLLEFDFA